MDQTTQSTEADEFYADYVKSLRAKRAEEERSIPATVTCHVEMEADVADALLDLIAQQMPKYSLRSQAYLARASKSIERAIRTTADALHEKRWGDD